MGNIDESRLAGRQKSRPPVSDVYLPLITREIYKAALYEALPRLERYDTQCLEQCPEVVGCVNDVLEMCKTRSCWAGDVRVSPDFLQGDIEERRRFCRGIRETSKFSTL